MPNEAPVQVKTKLKIFSGLPSLVLYFCVFFILLVFFMLSSNFVPLRGIEVNLPRTGGAGKNGVAPRPRFWYTPRQSAALTALRGHRGGGGTNKPFALLATQSSA